MVFKKWHGCQEQNTFVEATGILKYLIWVDLKHYLAAGAIAMVTCGCSGGAAHGL